MRSVRALGVHAGALLVLGAVAALVAGGTVRMADVAAAGGGSTLVLLPLVLLAAATLPLPAVELARARRPAVMLARMRGARGARLVGVVLAPPVVTAVVACLAGGLVGGLAGADDGIGVVGLRWGLGVSAGVVVETAACSWLVVREPLAAQVRRPDEQGWRPRGGLVTAVTALAVAVAAAASAYQATQSTQDDGRPSGLVLAGAALVGLTAGQLLVGGLAASAAALTGLGPSRSTAVLLGARRALGGDHAGRLRVVVAAAVVAAAAWCAVSTADGWADDTAAVALAAPVRVDLPGVDVLDGYLLTHRLDPDGRWLMAAAVSDSRVEPQLRVAWLDLARYRPVAGDLLAGRPGDLGPSLAALTTPSGSRPVDVVTGTAFSALATSGRASRVTVSYLSDRGYVESTRVRRPVRHCRHGCVVVGVTSPTPVTLDALRLGSTDLLGVPWTTKRSGRDDPQPVGTIVLRGGATAVPAAARAALPVVTAGTPTWPRTGPEVSGVDGDARPVDPVAAVAAVPLLGSAGVLGDLPAALAAAGGSVPGVETVVLAGADTPAAVLAALARVGDEPRTLDGAPDAALGADRVAEVRARRVLAGTSLSLGVVVLLGGLGRRRRAARHDRAVLRLLREPRATPVRAAVVEAALLGVTTAVAAGLGTWVAAVTVVDGSDLVAPGVGALAAGSTVSATLVVGAALAAAVATVVGVLVVCLPGLLRPGRGDASSPASLTGTPTGPR